MSNENIETGAVMKNGVLFLLAGTIVKLDGIPCRVAVDTPIESEHYRQSARQAPNDLVKRCRTDTAPNCEEL